MLNKTSLDVKGAQSSSLKVRRADGIILSHVHQSKYVFVCRLLNFATVVILIAIIIIIQSCIVSGQVRNRLYMSLREVDVMPEIAGRNNRGKGYA